jgi:hypothetical protein
MILLDNNYSGFINKQSLQWMKKNILFALYH